MDRESVVNAAKDTQGWQHRHPLLMFVLVVTIICAALYAAGYMFWDQIRFHQDTGLWYSKLQVIDYYDDYGWFGEGTRELVLRGNERQKKYVQTHWKPLPMSGRLTELVYRPADGYDLFRTRTREPFFPEIEEGAYLFMEDDGASEEVVGFHSDLILVLFDYADNRIYYYETDW